VIQPKILIYKNQDEKMMYILLGFLYVACHTLDTEFSTLMVMLSFFFILGFSPDVEASIWLLPLALALDLELAEALVLLLGV
jgi:hypothetical protein